MPQLVNNAVGKGSDAARYPEVDAGMLDLSVVRAFLWRQRWILISVVSLVVLAGAIITLLMTPSYSATASVRIDPQNAEVLEGQDLVDPFVASNEIARYLETLSRVIQSNSMAERVVDDLKLDEDDRFLGVDDAADGPAMTPAERRQLAVRVVQGGVDVSVPINTRLLEITYTSTDPQMAARVANSYAQNFVLADLTRSVEANAYAKQYLEEQIEETSARLRDSELAAIEYARANRIIGGASTESESGDVGTAPTLTVSNLSGVSEQLVEVRGERIAAEQRWREASARPAAQLSEVRSNPAVQGLMARLAEANAGLADLRGRYRDDYPAVQERQAEIASLEAQLDALSGQIKASLRSEFEIARQRELALERELSQASSQTLDEQDRRVQYNLLNRDVDAARMQLSLLLQRYNQIVAVSNFRSSAVTVLDDATVPTRHSSPNLTTNLFLALVLGIGLAVVLAILREVFDDRLRSGEDVERKLGLSSLGQVPHVAGSMEDELGHAFSPASEAYSSIRATLDFMLPPGGHHVIQITSGQPSEGKTTTSVALARRYASLGRKVLLVDFDLRRPAVANALGLGDDRKVRNGIVHVLYQRATLSEAVQVDPVSGLNAIYVGELPPNPVEILSSGLVPEFIERYRKDYDIIILDSSPVLGIADAPLISRYVDAVVFVVEANQASFGQTRTAIRRLRSGGAHILGAILTKYKSLDAGESYNYQYRYYRYGEAES